MLWQLHACKPNSNHARTHTHARTHARAQELLGGCATLSGCLYDQQMLWSAVRSLSDDASHRLACTAIVYAATSMRQQRGPEERSERPAIHNHGACPIRACE